MRSSPEPGGAFAAALAQVRRARLRRLLAVAIFLAVTVIVVFLLRPGVGIG